MSIVEEKVQLKKGDFVQVVKNDSHYSGLVGQILSVVKTSMNGETFDQFSLANVGQWFVASDLKLLTVATNAQVGDHVHFVGSKEICAVEEVVVSYKVRTAQGLIACSNVFVASEQERVAAIKKRCDELRKTADEAITQLSTQLALLTSK